MSEGPTTAQAHQQFQSRLTHEEAMKRLRRYCRDQDRPGRQLVNVAKVGRNDPCPCGSKKKFKSCCMSK